MKTNYILVAKKQSTGAILAYAIYTLGELTDARLEKQRVKSCYLHRIAVREHNQGLGLGTRLMEKIMESHPEHAVSVDVKCDNTDGIHFFQKFGLKFKRTYAVTEENIEHAEMEQEIDTAGQKIASDYEVSFHAKDADVDKQYLEYCRWNRAHGERIQRYYNSLEELHIEKNGDKKDKNRNIRKNKNTPK